MEKLFRQRMEFVTSVRDETCFICGAASGADPAQSLLLHRGDRALVILNRYPYNTGHVMVAPIRHVADITDLDDPEQAEIMQLTKQCVEVLRKELQPQGFNLGANLGEAAGAGLPGHFHTHIVPRWPGDTNFMPVVAEAKVLPELLEETYRRLTGKF
jgi:ATP adenylyltransferase